MAHKVLIIEDDVEINELLGEYLTLENITPIRAFDGKTGLDQALASAPDAIILDLMLPDIDGYEVCRHIASHRSTAMVPVIILTCLNQECDCLKGLSLGAFRYMGKPFLPDELIARLKDAFEWRRQLTLRPPAGQIEISTDAPGQALQGFNNMAADLFARSLLPEPSVVSVREGFQILHEWAINWGHEAKRNPRILINYRLNTAPGGALAAGAPAEVIEWTISELEPALLTEMLFKGQPMAAPSITVGNGTEPAPVQPSPLASWFRFLAKAGVGRLEKDTKLGRVHLLRSLRLEPAGDAPPLPTVTIDGNRVPTRLRQEAGQNKRP